MLQFSFALLNFSFICIQQQASGDEQNPPQFCVVQYVLFPPHVANTSMKDRYAQYPVFYFTEKVHKNSRWY